MANLRVKHEQIYNFPLQHIEPQVNWSTVIEEKQVPRGPPVSLLGKDSCSSPWRNRLLGNFWAAPSWEQQRAGWQGRGRGMGQGWLLWHQKSVLKVAPVLASASPVTACFRLYSTALIFYFIPLPKLFQPEKGSTPQTGFLMAALQHS